MKQIMIGFAALGLLSACVPAQTASMDCCKTEKQCCCKKAKSPMGKEKQADMKKDMPCTVCEQSERR